MAWKGGFYCLSPPDECLLRGACGSFNLFLKPPRPCNQCCLLGLMVCHTNTKIASVARTVSMTAAPCWPEGGVGCTGVLVCVGSTCTELVSSSIISKLCSSSGIVYCCWLSLCSVISTRCVSPTLCLARIRSYRMGL